MKGTKRRAVFEPTSQPNDSSISSTTGRSILDEQRAAASQKHVRALNTQFASWIQTQLKDHPDELWEDGVRDYLNHASSLLEKFSDVVEWLKENKTKGGIGHAEGSHIFPKETNDLKNVDFKSDVVNTGISQGSSTLGFSTPFVMPTFASKEANLKSDSVGLLQGNSAIFSSAPKFLPNFGNKEVKSSTIGPVMSDTGIKDTKVNSSGQFFAASTSPSFDNSKFSNFGNKEAKSNTSGLLMPDFGSKGAKLNSSGSFFTANTSSSFDNSKFTNFGTKETSLNTSFSFGNSTPSFGLSKSTESGSKEATVSTNSTGFSFGNSTPSFGLSKSTESGSKEATISTNNTGFSFGTSTPSFGLSKSTDSGSKEATISTNNTGFSFGNSTPSFDLSKSTDSGSKETTISTNSTGFSFGNSTPSFGLSKAMPDPGSKEADTNTTSTFFSGNSNLGFGNPKMASDSGQSYTPSWSSGAPFTFGNKSLTPVNTSASNDHEEEVEPEQPSSPSLKKTQEEGITVIHEVKCKLYVKSTDPADKDSWKDKGMGNLSIKCIEGATRGTKECKPTIVIRNDVGRLLLNALIYPGIKTNLQKNSIVAIFHTSDDAGNDGASNGTAVARTFLLRTKTEEDRDKLAAMIQECAPPV